MQPVTATVDGTSYTIHDVCANGGKIYIVAEDASNNLILIEKGKDFDGFNNVKGQTLIATGVA